MKPFSDEAGVALFYCDLRKNFFHCSSPFVAAFDSSYSLTECSERVS